MNDKIKDMSAYIQCAADTIGRLRKSDVYRVLIESNDAQHRPAIAAYIKHHRPDLADEVQSVLSESTAIS